jgi:transposase-like protein
VKRQIVDMAMNASGIRDTARVLHVSPNTVIKELNAWCELAKSLKRKGGFPDTQTESRLVQRITPLFSTTAFQ